MKIPNQIKVGGHVYKVLQNYKFNQASEYCGQADHNALEIRLSSNTYSGEKRADSRIQEAFIHEVVHCVDNVYNNCKLKEDTVVNLSEGLLQVINDNQLFRKEKKNDG